MAVLSLLAGSLHDEAAVWLKIGASHTVDVVNFGREILQNGVLARRLRSRAVVVERSKRLQRADAWTSRDSWE